MLEIDKYQFSTLPVATRAAIIKTWPVKVRVAFKPEPTDLAIGYVQHFRTYLEAAGTPAMRLFRAFSDAATYNLEEIKKLSLCDEKLIETIMFDLSWIIARQTKKKWRPVHAWWKTSAFSWLDMHPETIRQFYRLERELPPAITLV